MKSDINKFFIYSSIIITAVLLSCTDDPDIPEPTGTGYHDGVFVINEGNYGSGSGTLTFIKRDGTGLVQKVYQNSNTLMQLGNVVQSMNVIGDSAFIMVNNSNRIVVCHKYSMLEAATIEDVEKPRYMVNLNDGRFAVSCWDNTVKIFETNSLSQTDEIETNTGPEKMLLLDDRLWILNQGGLSVDSTITILNIQNGNKQSLQVYPRPTGSQGDADGNIWVMCSGRKDYHPGGFSPSHLIRIHPETLDITADISIQGGENDAFDLEVDSDGNTLFYLFKGDVYSFEINDSVASSQPFIDYLGSFYSLGYDPADNALYASDALDYAQNGVVYKYDATTGQQLFNFKASIIPGEYYFSIH
ncbi:MAG: hypothetical protein JW731_02635 [Bacteroidales bacterium]|nr:hypothetical protein [Bacteroidales bacterium]